MFKCRCILVLLTVLYVVQSEDAAIKDEEESQGGGAVGRAMRDFGGEDWKAVHEHQFDNSGWIASDNRQSQQEVSGVQTQKRRRLRKRKRRPQPLAESQTETQPRPRRRRPVRLDEVKDTWTEMEAESPKRPNNRRRVSPIYPVANQGVEASIRVEDSSLEKVKDPYIAMQEAVEKVRRRKIRISTTTNSPPSSVQDIKMLIKQSGGMSLSEILQQRNLSLSDLLKGKQQAISALAEKPKEVLPVTESFQQRITVVENNEEVTDKAILDAQRRRFGSLYSNSQNRIYSDVTKYDVVTEPATDKRIFVPSHPKYYTSLNYRPELGSFMDQAKVTTTEMSETAPQSSAITSSSTQATTKEISVQENVINKTPIRMKLPVTSAKLHRTVKKPSAIDNEQLPPKAIKINISDLFGYAQVTPENKTKESEGPLKMLFDLEELVKENVESLNTIIPIETTTIPTKLYKTSTKPETTKIYKTTSKVPKKPTQEKLKIISAKDEIMEILKDEVAKENLSKILKLRNMTVDELVELRERGSSQRHLADIFHNKTREPEPKVEHIGAIKMDRKPKSSLKIPYKIINNEYDIQSLADININSEEIITSEKIPGTSFPTYKIESNKQSKETPPLHIPIWKTIYPSVFNEPVIQKEIFNTKLKQIGEIENTIVEAVNEELSNRNNYDYDDFIQLPVGVKSAIFASLAIIGISLILFLTILMIFKWTQRHKKRLCYGGSFSCSKIKSPILESDSKRSIKSFMSETLGRKKSFYASSRLQSMSDSWDNDKPYQ